MSKQELLESPFLTDELFSRETDPEWEAGALSLASESPFVNAVEMRDSVELQETEPDLYEFESTRGLRRTSIQFRVLNYRGLPMRHYSLTAHVVDAATGRRILAGGPSSTGSTGVVTFPRALVPARGTLHLELLPEYYETQEPASDFPKLKKLRLKGEFHGYYNFDGTADWKRTGRVMKFSVTQESTKSTIRSLSKKHAEAKLTREGKAGFVIGPIEAGAGGGTESGTGRATEQEQTFQVSLALPSLRIVPESRRGSRELEADDYAEFVDDPDELEDLAADEMEPSAEAEDAADEEEEDYTGGEELEELYPELDEYELEESEEDEDTEDLVESETAKRGEKARNLHNVETNDVFLHMYMEGLHEKKLPATTRQEYFEWLIGQSMGSGNLNRFQQAGLEMTFVTNPEFAARDFSRSLATPGSVVVYLGHTAFTPAMTPRGLAMSHSGKKMTISCGRLARMLGAAKAKIVLLASCASSDCVRKISGDTIVIVTDSGKDRRTNALIWAPAIKAYLDALLAGGTAGDALVAANNEFKRQNSKDRFKMINGDRTVRLKP